MSLFHTLKRSLLLGALSAFALSAHATPSQSQVVVKNTEKGPVSYIYDGNRVKEMRAPNGRVFTYIYENGRLTKIVNPDGSVNLAVPVGAGKLVRVVFRPYPRGGQNTGTNNIAGGHGSNSQTDVQLLGTACQVNAETGETYNCYTWDDGGGNDGGGGYYGPNDPGVPYSGPGGTGGGSGYSNDGTTGKALDYDRINPGCQREQLFMAETISFALAGSPPGIVIYPPPRHSR